MTDSFSKKIKSNRGVNAIRTLILFFLLLLSACSVKTQVYKPLDLSTYKSGVLKIAIDYWELQDHLSYYIENMGIDVIDLNNTQEPDVLINVRYQPLCQGAFNLVECRFTFFDIYFRDAKTEEILISSIYHDISDLNTSFIHSNYVDYVLDLVFDDIKKKIQIQ